MDNLLIKIEDAIDKCMYTDANSDSIGQSVIKCLTINDLKLLIKEKEKENGKIITNR